MHRIRFPLGLRLKPRWGSLQRSPGSLAVFKEPILRGGRAGREGVAGEEGKGMEHEAGREEREGGAREKFKT